MGHNRRNPNAQGPAVALRSALHQRQADRGDDQHANERHLEAGGEELTRIEYEQPEGGCAQRIDHGTVAVKQPRTQEDGAHQRRSPHWRADFGKKGVGNAEENGEQSRGNVCRAAAGVASRKRRTQGWLRSFPRLQGCDRCRSAGNRPACRDR